MTFPAFPAIVYQLSPAILHPRLRALEASDIGSRLARGVFWTMAGSVISRGLMLCAMILVARILGKTGYGEFGMIQSTVGMFGVFAGFGLGLTATKHVAELRERDPERAGRIVGLSGVFALVTGGLMAIGLIVFAPWIAESVINAPHLSGVLRIGAIILFLNALNGAQTGALSGLEAFKTIAVVNFAVGLLSFPILVGGALIAGLSGAVWGLAINLGINWLINHLALRHQAQEHKIPLTWRRVGREARVLWTFSLPAALSGLMVAPSMWAGRAFLTNQPNGYEQLGEFSAAMIFQMPIIYVAGMIGRPLLAIVSNSGNDISDGLGTLNMLSSWVIGVSVAIPLICFPEVIEMFLGEEFATHSFRVTISIVIFYTTIMTFKSGLARVMAARNLLWLGVVSNALWSLILISSAYLLSEFGATGLALSFALAYAVNTVVIVPIYYARNLVPKGTLISMETFLIWIALFALVLLNVFDISLIARIGAFLVASIVAALSFGRLIKNAA
ncbi:MAG: oligosaccharide flippase family protein [Halioglobus sp.]